MKRNEEAPFHILRSSASSLLRFFAPSIFELWNSEFEGFKNPELNVSFLFMLTAELIAPREFRLSDQPIADPGPGEIQARVGAVGLCGSDLHSYSEGAVGDTPCVYPMVLGHEPSGTVVKTGAGVTGWSPGDRAALEPALYCYHCEFCRAGRHNVCANIRFLSTVGHPGFFRELVNLPVSNLLPIPKTLSLEAAALVEPLAIALHSLKFVSLEAGDTVAVFGAGPIGLVTIAALKVSGASRIVAVEPMPHRRELARQMGADVALDPNEIDAAQQILSDTHGRGVDCAMDCAAKEHTTNQAIRAARNGGRVVLTGIHSEVFVPFEVSPMRRKELAIFNVRRSNHESERALEMLVQRVEWFAPLVTHKRPLAEIADAFRLTEHYSDGVGKMVLVP
jgi:L-iditol 2-dehydrogenase